MMQKARRISAGEFKAKCLKLMDEVQSQGSEVVITKRGKPVAKLVPAGKSKERRSVYGCMKGTVAIHGDIVGPLEEDWQADRT